MNRSEMTLKTISEACDFLNDVSLDKEKSQYFNRVYDMLCKAKPGDRIEIDKIVKPENLPMFIGCVCMYILDTDKAEFDNEYKFIKKL